MSDRCLHTRAPWQANMTSGAAIASWRDALVAWAWKVRHWRKVPLHMSWRAACLVVQRVVQQIDAALAHNLHLLDVCGLVGLAGRAEVPAPSASWPSNDAQHGPQVRATAEVLTAIDMRRMHWSSRSMQYHVSNPRPSYQDMQDHARYKP